MKVKLPNKILLAGEEIKVLTPVEGKWHEAEGNFEKGEITIPLGGGLEKRPIQMLSLFIHETLEMIMNARGFNYRGPGGKLVFMLTHEDYRNIVDDLAMAIKDIEITHKEVK